jgi:hypothetical protein
MPVARLLVAATIAGGLAGAVLMQKPSTAMTEVGIPSQGDVADKVGEGGTPQPAGDVVAQSSCFASINSCKNINATQRCHATQKVIYTLQGGKWCKTPAPCTC